MRRTKLNNKPGIYQIQSTVNGKRYVGSTVNLQGRKRGHLKTLEKGGHHNPHLQNYTNKHGVGTLRFSILEFCLKEELIEREQYYINTLDPEFNICKIAKAIMTGRKHSEETKRKISEMNSGQKRTKEQKRRMGLSHKGIQHRERKRKPIYQFDINGNYLNKYKDRQEAAQSTGISYFYITRNVTNRFYTTDPFIWTKNPDNIHEKIEIFEKTISAKHSRSPVYQYNLHGNFIKKYKSKAEAKRQTKIYETSIRECIHGKLAQTGGFIWTNGAPPSTEQIKRANAGRKNKGRKFTKNHVLKIVTTKVKNGTFDIDNINKTKYKLACLKRKSIIK